MAFTLIDLAGGAGDINVNIALQEKTVDSSTKTQHVLPTDGYIGIKDVIVNPYVLDSSNAVITDNGEYVFESAADGLSRVDVSVNIPGPGAPLQSKTVDSSTKSQLVEPDSGNYGLSSVTVNPYTLDEKTVDSSTVSQVITSDADGLSKVTIKPYVLSPLEVDSSTATQEITGQYGTVKVNPYTLDSSSLVATENGEYIVTSSVDGLSRVDVSVNIDTQSYYNEGYSDGVTAGIAQQKAKLDKTTFTENGTYTREDGWNEIKVTVRTVNNQNKTVDASINSQTVTYDSGYTGLGTVTVNAYNIDSCYILAASI